MMKWLRDTYNGLVLVLIAPNLPKVGTLALLVVGCLIGLFWAYAIAPTIYYNADLRTLDQSWQDEWVKLLADRNAAANADVSSSVVQQLARIDDPLGVVDRLIATPGEEANVARLQAIRPFAEAAQANAVEAPPEPNTIGNILPFIIAPLVLLLLATLIITVFNMFIGRSGVEAVVKRLRGEKEAPEVRAAREKIKQDREAEATQKTDFTKSGLGAPVMQRMSNFTLGFGQYDDSFEIEDENEKFLGQCGAVISETIGSGSPQKPTAIEVWLFDKDDFVRTITKVFCSEHAYNDPKLRSNLEEKGDLVLARPGAVIISETDTLRLQARIVDMQYGTDGSLPPNSYFEKMTIELAAWRKEAGSAPASTPTPAPAVVTAVPVAPPAQTFAPPPPPVNAPPPRPVEYQPAPYQPPAPRDTSPMMPPPPDAGRTTAPLRPAAAPPPSRPAPDDDPFGGTGDFTPIS